ncbi:MAG: hypothetical protein JWR69_625 [Pedosphaera sp.]|nr:hypothetical protein [Pedosphaera sp.]
MTSKRLWSSVVDRKTIRCLWATVKLTTNCEPSNSPHGLQIQFS